MPDRDGAGAGLEAVYRWLGPALQEISGSRVSGEIPLSETLVNQLIAEGVRRSPDGPVEAAEARLRAGGEASVRVRLRRPRFVPPVTIQLRIEQQPTPEAPHLVLRWELPALGGLAALAAPVMALIRTERPGITVEGDRIRVNVPTVLRDAGAGPVLDYLTALRVETRDAALVVAFELRVS